MKYALFLNLDVNQSTDDFYVKVNETFDKCVPVKVRGAHNHPKYFNEQLINLKNRTNKASKVYRDSRSDIDYKKFSDLRKQFKSLSSLVCKNYVDRIGSELKENPKRFYEYVNEKRKTNGFPSNMVYKDNMLSDVPKIFEKLDVINRKCIRSFSP